MSIFDDVVGKVTGGATAGGGRQALVTSVLEMLSNRQGGISGLAETFQQNGLGHIVSSWIGTGGNLPVSPDQVQQVFGNEQIQALAQKAGIAPEVASSQLAELLPGVVDKLTPAGRSAGRRFDVDRYGTVAEPVLGRQVRFVEQRI